MWKSSPQDPVAEDHTQPGKISEAKQILPQLPSLPGPSDQLLLLLRSQFLKDLRNPYNPSGSQYPFSFATQNQYRILSFIFLLASNLNWVKKKKTTMNIITQRKSIKQLNGHKPTYCSYLILPSLSQPYTTYLKGTGEGSYEDMLKKLEILLQATCSIFSS